MGAMLPVPFDPKTVQPSGGGGNLPISDANGHAVIITDAEMKATQDNSGSMLVLHLKVIDGVHAESEGLFRLNIGNNNAQAVEIAYRQLSSICHAINYFDTFQDLSALYNKPFRVVVGLQKGEEAASKGYTEVKAVKTIDGRKPGDKGPPPAPSPAPAPVAQYAAPIPQAAPQAAPVAWPSVTPPLASQQPPQPQPQPQPVQQSPTGAAVPWHRG